MDRRCSDCGWSRKHGNSQEIVMIENLNTVINQLKTSEFGKTTRKSAQAILKANLHAWSTTRDELGKVVGFAMKQSQQFTKRSRARTEEMVGGLSDVANERVTMVEKRPADRRRGPEAVQEGRSAVQGSAGQGSRQAPDPAQEGRQAQHAPRRLNRVRTDSD
jgi:hypothetical protein